MTMSSKTKFTIFLIASNIILVLLCLILFIRVSIKDKQIRNKDISDANKVTQITEFEESKSFTTASGEKIILEDSDYVVRPGYTFYVDKGNMKLFADITPMDEGKVLSITAKEYHNEQGYDVEMTDAAINDAFTLDLNTGEYYNTNNDMALKYDGLSATFTDKRNVALKFSGTLQLIRSIATDGNSDISALNPSDIVSYNVATEVPSEQISSDGLDSLKSSLTGDLITDEYYEGAYPKAGTSTFESDLTPANERSKMTITAKFIESTSNSGTKYQEVNSGILFYAFGQKYPYDPSNCNVVTMTAIYRGTEQHFNGLQMDNKYPCFVIDSIRKVTADELN